MKSFNLVLSGGGVKTYAHLGVYKYCFERGITFDEIVAVSGGALIAPFIFLKRNPDSLIYLFKEAKIHTKLLPFWFVPDKFEFLFYQPSTKKLGKWVESQLTKAELDKIQSTTRLHIMATRRTKDGLEPAYCDMLCFASLKDAIASSCAISGIFKAHKIGKHCFIDGAHWNNLPLFFDFKDPLFPVLAINLNYLSPTKEHTGRFSKIFAGLEISSYARFKEDIKRWDIEKKCKNRGELYLVTPKIEKINSLDLDISDKQINELIELGYNAALEVITKEKEPLAVAAN